jgi:MSHA biogenesis protein MshK
MADRLTRSGLLLLLAIAAPLRALGQAGLADPTRPPPGATSEMAGLGEAGGPTLQSVIIPKKGKPMAVIGGQQVVLGGMYGDSRLISLTEREAVLEGPAGIERLRLTPGIEKTNIVTKSPVAKSTQSRGKP